MQKYPFEVVYDREVLADQACLYTNGCICIMRISQDNTGVFMAHTEPHPGIVEGKLQRAERKGKLNWGYCKSVTRKIGRS